MGRAREESDWAGVGPGMAGLWPGKEWVGLRKDQAGHGWEQVGVGGAIEEPGCMEAWWWVGWQSGRGQVAHEWHGLVWAGPGKGPEWVGPWMEWGNEGGWGTGHGQAGGEPTAAFTHLLQLQPHFVEGSQPVGLGPRHGVLTLLAFLIFSWPESEATGFMRLRGQHSLHPPPSERCWALHGLLGTSKTQ